MAVELEITSDSRQARRDLNQLNQSVDNIDNNLRSAGNTARSITRTFQVLAGVATGLFAGSAITRAADNFRNINSQLRLVTCLLYTSPSPRDS